MENTGGLVNHGKEKRRKKKDLSKQFPVTYILSSQFRAKVINVQKVWPLRTIT